MMASRVTYVKRLWADHCSTNCGIIITSSGETTKPAAMQRILRSLLPEICKMKVKRPSRRCAMHTEHTNGGEL